MPQHSPPLPLTLRRPDSDARPSPLLLFLLPLSPLSLQVLELKEEFSKFDDKKKGELEVDQAMRLLEARHETKTYTELRELLKSIDQNSNNLLSLLEWLCAFFNKSWETVTTPDAEVDVEAIKAELMAEAKKKEEEAQAAELEYQRARVQSMAVGQGGLRCREAGQA